MICPPSKLMIFHTKETEKFELVARPGIFFQHLPCLPPPRHLCQETMIIALVTRYFSLNTDFQVVPEFRPEEAKKVAAAEKVAAAAREKEKDDFMVSLMQSSGSNVFGSSASHKVVNDQFSLVSNLGIN